VLVMHVFGKSGLEYLEHEHLLDSGTHLLQIHSESQQRRTNKVSCLPSGLQDGIDNRIKKVLASNQTLISQLTTQGRIRNGFPDWTFVHIPKTGGDTFGLSSGPLYPVGMGDANTKSPKADNDHCYFIQLPPNMILPTQEHVYRDKTVFCAVRNPYERAISGACHMLQYEQQTQSINASMIDSYIKMALEQYKSNKLTGCCFWIPQVEYTEGPLGCTRVINFAHLEQEYNDLMEEAGYNLKLAPDTTHRCAIKCDLTKDDLDPSTVRLLSDFYAADFERWGQEFGWTK